MPVQDSIYFTRSQKRGILALVLCLVLIMLAMATYQLAKPEPRVRIPVVDSLYVAPEFETKEPVKLDINLADSARWTRLRGVGPVLAQRIVKFRRSIGGFRTVAQVQDTYGISDSVFASWQGQLFFNPLTFEDLPKRARPADSRPNLQPMDLNAATAEELKVLPGIGPVLSQRIVKFRASRGGFRSVEDLAQVYQLRPETLRRIKPYLYVNRKGRSPSAGNVRGEASSPTPLDINEADSAELVQLPGMKPWLAGRIIRYRQLLGFYYKLDQLRSVYGIQEADLERLLPYLLIGDVAPHPKGRLNRASAAQLGFLNEVDGYLAEAIVKQRQAIGGYHTWAEVASVPGLNDEALAELKVYYQL